jgi:hypothetical protein
LSKQTRYHPKAIQPKPLKPPDHRPHSRATNWDNVTAVATLRRYPAKITLPSVKFGVNKGKGE